MRGNNSLLLLAFMLGSCAAPPVTSEGGLSRDATTDTQTADLFVFDVPSPPDGTIADDRSLDTSLIDQSQSDRPLIDTPVMDQIQRDVVLPRDTVVPDVVSVVTATNPVLGEDHPDPHVVRTNDASGRVIYYLYPTAGEGDFSVWESRDLLRWSRRSETLFRRSSPGGSLEINGGHFCHLWAPDVVEVRSGVWMLSFSAVRYRTAQNPCPPYREDGGVYFASSSSPLGPFALASRPWEPLTAGGHITDCPSATNANIPHSVPYSSQDCQGGYCHHIIRLDSAVFRDPMNNRWWLGYSWYTNTPPRVAWEQTNYGQHANLVELNPSDPFTVQCNTAVAQIPIGNPHDTNTLSRLRTSCARCGEQLSFTRARDNQEFRREGFVFGVNEGISLFRRGGYVYALLSGSVWDSAYYNVWYVAAPTVEGLSLDNPSRLVGRFLIPNQGQSFGHGTPVLGPDGMRWYYVHHRLQADRCRTTGNCARDVWVSPIEFENRGDGRGDVWIRTRFPAESPGVTVAL